MTGNLYAALAQLGSEHTFSKRQTKYTTATWLETCEIRKAADKLAEFDKLPDDDFIIAAIAEKIHHLDWAVRLSLTTVLVKMESLKVRNILLSLRKDTDHRVVAQSKIGLDQFPGLKDQL